MKKILLALAIMSNCLITFSQNSVITGVVTDEKGVGLPGANLFIDKLETGTIADALGKFTFKDVPDGEYNLTVSYIGYNNYSEEIVVNAEKMLDLKIVLNEGLTLDEVIISPDLHGQSKALNSQKNSINITNMVSSEMIEQFPDANIGDGLKRIPGINVQYDQGEARFINIRGTAPELNSVMINGERIPSAEGEARSVQADLVPADMIENIEVTKALTPDMEGDAVGGAVNLITKNAPQDLKIKVNLGAGYGLLSQKPIWKGKFEISNRLFDDKLGFVISASAHDNKIRSDNVEAEWEQADDGTIYTSDHEIRQYYVERFRQSYSLNLDYKINPNHTIYLKGIYNWRNDWENRFRTRTKVDYEDGQYIGEIIRQTKAGTNRNARLEDQRVISLALSGEHVFNKLSVDWKLSISKAQEDRPNERYIAYNIEDIDLNTDFLDMKKPYVTPANQIYNQIDSNWGLDELTEEHQYTEELDKVGSVNFDYLLNSGTNKSILSFGGKYRIKNKYRDNDFYEYEPIDEEAFNINSINSQIDKTNSDFDHGNYVVGNLVSDKYLGGLDLNNGDIFGKEQDSDELAGNYEAEENVTAGYAMITQNLGEQFQFLAGVRIENTIINYQWKPVENQDGTDASSLDEETNSYTNYLPAFHIKYSISKWTNIRFAWTNSLARPKYFDLVPYVQIDGTDEIDLGNPDLKATRSMNFDLLGEHFFNNVGLISGGFFYKNLKDIIAVQLTRDVVYNGITYDEMYQPLNAGSADLYGFELAIQRRLNFLPGFLRNFSIYANYTYTKSELKDIKIEDREDEKLPLSGTPQNVLNTSLAFNSKKFDARISFNYASDFIEEYADEAFFDRYYDAVSYLDFNADYKLNDMIQINFFVNNILNQPLRYFQGEKDRTMQMESYGVRINLGIKFKF